MRAASAPHHESPDAGLAASIPRDPDRWAHFEQPPSLGVPTLRVDTAGGLAPEFADILAFVRPGG